MPELLRSFLVELMKQRHLLPSHLAADLGVSHASVSRWLSGKDKPSPKSCQRLAEYAGVRADKVLIIAGYLPRDRGTSPVDWPEVREYAHRKYPRELDEYLIAMLEDLIQIRRTRRIAPNSSN